MQLLNYVLVISATIFCVYADDEDTIGFMVEPTNFGKQCQVITKARNFLKDAEELITDQYNKLESQLGKQNLDFLIDDYIKRTEKSIRSRLCDEEVIKLVKEAGRYEMEDFASCRQLDIRLGEAKATLEKAINIIEGGGNLLDEIQYKIQDCSKKYKSVPLAPCVPIVFASYSHPFLNIYTNVTVFQQKMNEHSLKANTVYFQCSDDVQQYVVWNINNVITRYCYN